MSTLRCRILRAKQWYNGRSDNGQTLLNHRRLCVSVRVSQFRRGNVEQIQALVELLAKRNATDERISRLIQRPATRGHIGEFIAAHVFDIRLMESATNKAIDGVFCSGPLAGRSVDVKFYGKQEGLLAINEDAQPDYFLVLTGPKAAAVSSRGSKRLLVIDHVYLFEGKALAEDLRRRQVKFGVAASIRSATWEAAEVFPRQRNSLHPLSEGQRQMLALFASGADGQQARQR